VDAAVSRALATLPGDRFATPRAFADALAAGGAGSPPAVGAAAAAATPAEAASAARVAERRRKWGRRSAAAVAAAALLGAAAAFVLGRRGAEPTESGPRRLAVLPFDNLGDSSTAYFADGMADAVRGKLASLPEFRVIARGSSDQYRRRRASPETIGRELGVQYLVTATVRWERRPDGTSRVQVSPELVRASDGTTDWQQPFDAPMTDVFAVQADIATRVASALHVALDTTRRQSLAERPTTNLAAYDAYLRGMEIGGDLDTDPASQSRAIAYFVQAVRLDSSFAEAWSRLGRALSFHYGTVAPKPETADSARQAIARAQALAPNSTTTLLAEATYNAFVSNDPGATVSALGAAVRTTPGNAELLSSLAIAQQASGDLPHALQNAYAAVALDPRSTWAASRLVTALLWLRRTDEAIVEGQRMVALDPSSVADLQLLVMAYLERGDSAAAYRVLREQGSRIAADRLAAYFALYWDTYWVLDPHQQALLFTLPPAAFDNDVASRALILMQTAWLRGDSSVARAYADTAQAAIGEVLKRTPNDGQQHVLRGLALAYLGRGADALDEVRRGVGLAKDTGISGPYYRHVAARAAMLVGDHAAAIATLDSLLRRPYFLTPGWLRVDPTWNRLRGDPAFDRLAAGKP
jgi:TolB-like protein/tetratricopeptide (TPR) repeat protein